MGFSCQGVSKTFPLRNGNVQALADVSFDVADREIVSVVGPSGCGKTTLLKLVAGLLPPTGGRITFTEAGPDGHPACALVFQEHGLFPWMTVVDNVAFGLEARGVPAAERRERARAFLDTVGLSRFASSFPHQLSVGMRQRAGIARALLVEPRVLLLDEPLGSLDAQTRLLLQEELLRLWARSGSTVVHVTHDIEEAILLGDRVLILSGRPGRIRQDLEIPLERPRRLEVSGRGEVAALRWEIWRALEEEARLALGAEEPAAAESAP